MDSEHHPPLDPGLGIQGNIAKSSSERSPIAGCVKWGRVSMSSKQNKSPPERSAIALSLSEAGNIERFRRMTSRSRSRPTPLPEVLSAGRLKGQIGRRIIARLASREQQTGVAVCNLFTTARI
jgi:hypothetical protein